MLRSRFFLSKISLCGLTALMMYGLATFCVNAVVAPSVAVAQDADVADDAESIEVAASVQRFAGRLFGTHEVRGAGDLPKGT